jgi:hypothetical protein
MRVPRSLAFGDRGQQNHWIQLIFGHFSMDEAKNRRGPVGRESEWIIMRRPVVQMDSLPLTRYVLFPGPQKRGTGGTLNLIRSAA